MKDIDGKYFVNAIPTPQPITKSEFLVLVELHRAMPQCQLCMQPQRCVIGRLLDTIAKADEFTRR